MPSQVPIEVFCIGRTVVDEEEVARWMKHIGADEFELPDSEAVSNPALLIALAGKRCYMSFQPGLNKNVTRIRQDYVAYFDNVLASGHGSVLEHSVFNLAIEGVSRVFTAEMNRHRAGWAISEGSLRFIRFGDNVPYWEPDSIRGDEPNSDSCDQLELMVDELLEGQYDKDVFRTDFDDVIMPQTSLNGLAIKQALTRRIFKRAFSHQEVAYRAMEMIWADELAPTSKFAGKKQITSMMRRIIGLGVATGGIWSGNIRALRHVFTMRAAPEAEEEMIHVFSRVTKLMVEKEPLLFGDFYTDEQGFWRPKYKKV